MTERYIVGPMDRRTDEWKDRRTDAYTFELMGRFTYGHIQTDRHMDKRKIEQLMDKQTKRYMDE